MTIAKSIFVVMLIGVVVSFGCITPPPPPKSTVKEVVVQPGQWVSGEAIWYGEMYHGRRTTSGEQFDMRLMTGAHSTIPFGSNVEVVNPQNQQSVTIVVNDRSHLDKGVDLALSKAAANALGLVDKRRFMIEYRWVE